MAHYGKNHRRVIALQKCARTMQTNKLKPAVAGQALDMSWGTVSVGLKALLVDKKLWAHLYAQSAGEISMRVR